MGYPTLRRLHGKLSPWLIGLPYIADRATRLGGSPHLSCKRDHEKILVIHRGLNIFVLPVCFAVVMFFPIIISS